MRQINWNDITINQYFILQKNLSGVTGYDRAIGIACHLHGLDVDKEKDKGVGSLSRLIDSIKFFSTLPMDNPKCTANIGGKEVFFKPLASITSGEFIDIQSYEQDKNLDSLDTVAWQIARLSVSAQIKLLEEGDGYKAPIIIKEQYEKVLQMSMSDFCSLYSFFLNKQKNSKNVFLLYLVSRLNKRTKLQLKQTLTEITLLRHFSLSLKGWRLKISILYLRNYRRLLALRCSNLRLSWNLNKANNAK
jgi:hypothetical protein